VLQRIRAHYALPLVLIAALLAAALMTATAGAAGKQTVKCVGTADFCGATVSIAGGASNKVIIVNLTDTDFRRVGVQVIPANSKGAFSISKASFRLGGSQYQFTLNAVNSNPKGARIILLFAAGAKAG
jgi:hypothetical protein